MKIIKILLIGTVVMFITSCASTAIFPISSVTPGAEISAKLSSDKNKNSVLEVTAKNLASADRLNPPKNSYVVWILTEKNEIKNLGVLNNNKRRDSVLKSTTAFKIKEVFITAEDLGNVSYPVGIEISRTKF